MDRNESLSIVQAIGTRKPRTGSCRRPRFNPYPFVATVRAGSSSPFASCHFTQQHKGQDGTRCRDGCLEQWNGSIDSAPSIENHRTGDSGFPHVEHGTEVCEPLQVDERSPRMDEGESQNEWKIFQRRAKGKDATGLSSRNVRAIGDELQRAANIKRTSHDGSRECERINQLENVDNVKSSSQGNVKQSYYHTEGRNYSGSGRRHSAFQSLGQKDDSHLSRRSVDDVGKDSIFVDQDQARNTDCHRLGRVVEDGEQHLRLKNRRDGRDTNIQNSRQPHGRIGHESGRSKRNVFELPSIPFLEMFPSGDRRSAKLMQEGCAIHTLASDGEQPDSLRPSNKGKKQLSGGTGSLRNCSNAPGFSKHRQRLLPQDNSEDEDNGYCIRSREQSSGKDVSLSTIHKVQPSFELNGTQEEGVGRMSSSKSLESSADASQPLLAVRKSSRAPKKRIFDGDEDMELEPKRRRKKKTESVSESGQCCVEEEGNDVVGDFVVESVSEFQSRYKRQWKKKDEPQSPELEGKKELPLTARQRALKCSKEGGDSEPGANSIEFPEGLTHRISKKHRENLSEAEQAIKKEEAARKRKQQSEKHDKETQENAIQKILGQDSSRKKREEKIQRQRKEMEQDKQAAGMIPATNSIRWVMGPSGNVVSFSEDLDLPMIFSGPCSYPQEREKCAAPLCNNAYKYRDSKTRLPLCSLQCYRAIQPPPSTAPSF